MDGPVAARRRSAATRGASQSLRDEARAIRARARAVRQESAALAAAVGRLSLGVGERGSAPDRGSAADDVGRLLAGLASTSASVLARMPWLDADDALDRALDEAGRAAGDLPPEQLAALADGLRDLARGLGRRPAMPAPRYRSVRGRP